MSDSTELVERIVRDVLQELGTSAKNVRNDEGTLAAYSLTAAVITADVLEKLAQENSRVLIGRQSILTPSARDYLRTHNIECIRQDSSATNGVGKSGWTLVVLPASPESTRLRDEGVGQLDGICRQVPVGTTQQAVSTAIDVISRNEGAVVVAEDVEVVACLANRNRNVRAAVVRNTREAARATRRIGANLFCVDPDGKTYFELQNLLRQIASGGEPRIPNGWSESTT